MARYCKTEVIKKQSALETTDLIQKENQQAGVSFSAYRASTAKRYKIETRKSFSADSLCCMLWRFMIYFGYFPIYLCQHLDPYFTTFSRQSCEFYEIL